MLIPVRCFTCNKPIAHLRKKYEDFIISENQKFEMLPIKERTKEISDKHKLVKGLALEICGLDKYCCKTVFLGQTDILEDVIKCT